MEIKITAKDITKLKIEPTDIVVITIPEPMARKETAKIHEALRRVFLFSLDREPGIIFIPSDFDIKAMQAIELRALRLQIDRMLKRY